MFIEKEKHECVFCLSSFFYSTNIKTFATRWDFGGYFMREGDKKIKNQSQNPKRELKCYKLNEKEWIL
jgi:hypothetical protein